MISNRTILITLGMISIMIGSCSKNQVVMQPAVALTNTAFVRDTSMKKMEGIYSLSSGNDALDNQFVCKTSKFRVSFFGNKSGIFMILEYGLDKTDSSLKFAGFWRFSERATQGLVNFSVPKDQALAFLKTGDISNLSLSGSFIDGNGNSNPISLAFNREFSDFTKKNPFEIYAHHGIQTTSNPPFAANSINAVLHAEDYGCTGIEFDVQLTKDKIPICMHDGSIDVNFTEKSPLMGDFNQYNFAFLEKFIRLVDGQKIPSLDQVCTAFIDSTNMTYLWMDIKGDDSIFQALYPVMQKAYAHAAAVGRNVVIYADLPSQDVIDEFNSYPPYREAGFPTMVELELQDVINTGSIYWGPRYSRGLLLDEVAQAHSKGIKVISWTLNDQGIIHNYLVNGQFDGFITDYPAYVVYDYYTMK